MPREGRDLQGRVAARELFSQVRVPPGRDRQRRRGGEPGPRLFVVEEQVVERVALAAHRCLVDLAQQRLGALGRFDGVIDLAVLKQANVVPALAERAKVFLSGKLDKAVTLKGLAVTKGAQAAILQAGGKVEV
ncbi:MAG: uL15m family ribosomal protein [Pseudomonadota bacterium]